jgi:hypothetical protein
MFHFRTASLTSFFSYVISLLAVLNTFRTAKEQETVNPAVEHQPMAFAAPKRKPANNGGSNLSFMSSLFRSRGGGGLSFARSGIHTVHHVTINEEPQLASIQSLANSANSPTESKNDGNKVSYPGRTESILYGFSTLRHLGTGSVVKIPELLSNSFSILISLKSVCYTFPLLFPLGENTGRPEYRLYIYRIYVLVKLDVSDELIRSDSDDVLYNKYFNLTSPYTAGCDVTR